MIKNRKIKIEIFRNCTDKIFVCLAASMSPLFSATKKEKAAAAGLNGKIISGGGILAGIFIFFALFFPLGSLQAATVDLASLIQQGGDTIILNPANTYVLNSEYYLTRNLTILGNGANISGTGPLRVHGSGLTLTVDNCTVQSTGWGALAASNGSKLIVRNSRISCPGGTGIFVNDAELAVDPGTSIASCWIGINLYANSKAGLHGITVTGCPYAVQATGPSTSVTVDQNSSLSYSGEGTGVGVLAGAKATIRDSALTGFTNAIDIHPSTPAGTATVVNCRFIDNGCSALSAVSAENVLFSGCRVQGAKQDGIYFNKSTGVVENSEVIDSLNTGVTFMACSNGATIRNSLVKNSAHQGLAIVSDSVIPSLNAQAYDNTFSSNAITNLLIDASSTAKLQGNIFSDAPDASVRLHGPKGITFDSQLVMDSKYGMEIKGSRDLTIPLSHITGNNTNGILIYNNSSAVAEHSSFWLNGLSTAESGWSVLVNEESVVRARYCSFGPAGNRAFFNNAYNLTSDVVSNFWDAADGPGTPQVSGGGSGAILNWNFLNWARVTYLPFLTQAPVESKVNSNLSLASGGSLNWDSALAVGLSLTAKTGSQNLTGENAGVLRVNDTDQLSLVQLPQNFLSGKLFVVWVGASLRSNSSAGSLKFSLPSQTGAVSLQRRRIDGVWISVSSVWDSVAKILNYSPADTYLLNGTFALTGGGDTAPPSAPHGLSVR